MPLSVKPRAGDRSAQLVKSVLSKRINRRIATSIGSVQRGADLATGAGLRFRPGYSLATLEAEDLARIRAWLDSPPKGRGGVRPTLHDIDAKLGRLLARIEGPIRDATPSDAGVRVEPVAAAGEDFEAFERALAAALRALTAQVDAQTKAGVKLTRKSHLATDPLRPGNGLDELQAWTNRCRFRLFEEFKTTCQRLGLWKSQSSGEAGASGD